MSAGNPDLSQSTPAPGRYDAGAVAFHWATFALVVVVGVLGLLHDSWPDASQAFWINLHAVLGLVLWFTLIARLGWRSRHAPPPLPAHSGDLARRLSGPVHWALYALMFAMPLIGWGMLSAASYPVVLFGSVHLPSILPVSPSLHTLLWHAHYYLAFAFFATILMHVAAILFHKLVRNDGVFETMAPVLTRDRPE